jgi:hypothetical protein
MPVNITFAGENTCKYMSEPYIRPRVETYQTRASADSGRKRVEDVHGWAQPLGQSLIATVRFVKFSNLILKDGEDGVSRVAILQLGGERMFDKVFLRLLLVGFESGFKYSLEA